MHVLYDSSYGVSIKGLVFISLDNKYLFLFYNKNVLL